MPNTAENDYKNTKSSLQRRECVRKDALQPLKFHLSFPVEQTRSANRRPHQFQDQDEQRRSFSGPHHTVGSLRCFSGTSSSMSFSMRFLLQNLTHIMMPSRIRMTPQAPPTAAIRMLISDNGAAIKTSQNQCKNSQWKLRAGQLERRASSGEREDDRVNMLLDIGNIELNYCKAKFSNF